MSRGWIVDIPIAQKQQTTLKKKDERIPKGAHGIP
jgi:hypothetical protein